MARLFLEVDMPVVAEARVDPAGVAEVLAASEPVVPWFERATPSMPPQGVPLSDTR